MFVFRATGAGGMNREEAPGKSPEDMYIQQKVRVLLMLKKMGSNVSSGALMSLLLVSTAGNFIIRARATPYEENL